MLEVIGRAIGMFAVTNVDDIVLLALWFGAAGDDRAAQRRVVAGQYLGLGAIVVLAVVAAAGLSVLPEDVLAYLGLIPVALGVRAAVSAWRDRSSREGPPRSSPTSISVLAVAGITLANGGDNVGVYVPVFVSIGAVAVVVTVAVFAVMIALWCLAGRWVAHRPVVARFLERWGHVVLPVVLIAIGVAVLVEGGAFGL